MVANVGWMVVVVLSCAGCAGAPGDTFEVTNRCAGTIDVNVHQWSTRAEKSPSEYTTLEPGLSYRVPAIVETVGLEDRMSLVALSVSSSGPYGSSISNSIDVDRLPHSIEDGRTVYLVDIVGGYWCEPEANLGAEKSGPA